MARGKSKLSEKYNTPFASALRQLMLVRDCTQDVLASVTGRTRQTVSQYVNGVSEPPYEVLVKIAEYFNVTTDYLLGLTSDPSRKPSAADGIGLSPESIANLRDALELDEDCIPVANTLLSHVAFWLLLKRLLDVAKCTEVLKEKLDTAQKTLDSEQNLPDNIRKSLYDAYSAAKHSVVDAVEEFRDIVGIEYHISELYRQYEDIHRHFEKLLLERLENGND